MTPRFEIYKNTDMTVPVEYAAIKAGIIQLTKYLAKYCKGHKIRANCVSPGGILNKQPQSFQARYNKFCTDKGLLQPDDIAHAVLFLLSDASLYINGQNLIIDDGFSL